MISDLDGSGFDRSSDRAPIGPPEIPVPFGSAPPDFASVHATVGSHPRRDDQEAVFLDPARQKEARNVIGIEFP